MTKRQPELSAPFALDAADPDFWTQRLGMVGDFIVELEAMGADGLTAPPKSVR